MNMAFLTIVISPAVAVAVVVLTYFLTKKKEREVDWRKVKLDLYKAYVIALSGVVKLNKTHDDQAKYADAVNSLTLVAPPTVLRALYAFQDEVAGQNTDSDLESRLHSLLSALRQDIDPLFRGKSGDLAFRFMAPPPGAVDSSLKSPPAGP